MKTLRLISKTRAFRRVRVLAAILLVLAAAALVFLALSPPASAQPSVGRQHLTPTFSKAVAFDLSPALRNLPRAARPSVFDPNKVIEVRPEGESEGPEVHSKGYSGDAALQALSPAIAIPSPLANFEGLSNQDNFNIFGFRVNPPDPNGEVGRNHYVEMVNLLFAVYDKGKLIYAGRVGTGFTFKQRSDLKKQLDKLSREASPLAVVPRDPGLRHTHWAEPKLVAEVAFTEWTSDGSTRHPSFQGLREDKNAKEVIREDPKNLSGGGRKRR